jgi:hypothetical protein
MQQYIHTSTDFTSEQHTIISHHVIYDGKTVSQHLEIHTPTGIFIDDAPLAMAILLDDLGSTLSRIKNPSAGADGSKKLT